MSAADAGRILTVCTGNICRSPMVERLFRARLAARLGPAADGIEVRSAGTWGHEGDPMEEFAAECLIELGGDPTGFVARELDADMIAAADVILAASREHRAAVVTMVPRSSGRCFTVREFARLLGSVSPSELPPGPLPKRLLGLVEAAAGNRGMIRPDVPGDDDIEDPYGAPLRVFARVAGVIDEAVAVPVALLAG